MTDLWRSCALFDLSLSLIAKRWTQNRGCAILEAFKQFAQIKQRGEA